jgi:two-component system, chemotaxis family, chemotaxis protein CheY
MRVLIADDDTAIRFYHKAMMSAYAESSEEAATGNEAVEAYRQSLDNDQPFDLILMDIMMPVMDGLQALECIRGLEKTRGLRGDDAVKVLMVSSRNDPKNINRAFFQGQALDFIHKPMTSDELHLVLIKFDLIQD